METNLFFREEIFRTMYSLGWGNYEMMPLQLVSIGMQASNAKVLANYIIAKYQSEINIEKNLISQKKSQEDQALLKPSNNTNKTSSTFFQRTKKFCDTFDDSWESVVTINRDEISIKIYPGENNSYHKNKTEVFRSAIGKIMNGKIFIKKGTKYIPDLYKFENGILYEMNDEGTYNDYKQCK